MNRLLIAICLLLFALTAKAQQPQFKGGKNELISFLSDNLIYPEYSKQNCISGTIQVSFNIDQSGKLSHVKVYKGLGIDLDDEAVRVVRLTSGKWIVPAGFSETENVILPVNFKPEATRCQSADESSLNQAIDAYRSRQALVDAVTNYYSNKYLGKADTTKEQSIITLKTQLGLDDDYIADVLKDASEKLKQGDHDGACEDWLFIRNIGSTAADSMLSKYCH